MLPQFPDSSPLYCPSALITMPSANIIQDTPSLASADGGQPPSAFDPHSISLVTWSQRGKYHLNRKEFDLALESFTQALQKAEKDNNKEDIGESLKNIGRLYLEKGQWLRAAKIFNAAFCVLQTTSPDKSQQGALMLMTEVERLFLEKVCKVRVNPNSKRYVERRQALQALRATIANQLCANEPSETILSKFSHSIGRFVEEMIQCGRSILGNPPCEYAFIGLGSLARGEMSPFSDLEFAVLVAKSGPKELDYFRKLVRWLEIQVIHLGETSIKILDHGHESPVVRGFSFDDGGNTPLGKEGYIELIKTPQELAQYQSERFYQEDLILSNVLRGTNFLVGSRSLYAKYIESIQVVLSSRSPKTSVSIGKERALNLLTGHLLQFEPRLDRKKEETPIYNIKEELYRLPSFLIACLADYFGIEEQNTWQRLKALVRKKILSEEGAKNIQEALSTIMHLRIRCHLHYERECDDVYHSSMQLKGGPLQNVFVLTDADVSKIIGIYQVILPLHRVFKRVCETNDFSQLVKETFYDSSLQIQAEAYKKLYQYKKAIESYQQAVALSPDDATNQLRLGQLFFQLAEYPQVKECVRKAMNLGFRLNEQEVISQANNLQGLICEKEGDAKKAIQYYKDALKIGIKVYGDEHPDVASSLNNLGSAWQDLGDAKKAIRYCEKALRIYKKVFGDEHPNMAISLNYIGSAWYDLGDAKKAIQYYEEALKICKKVYGDDHPDVASSLNSLGSAWQVLGDAKKSISYYEGALRIGKKCYGDVHPFVAVCLNNIGSAWHVLGDAKKAIGYHEEVLRIYKKVFGDEHP
ncbi:MAG: tetratricopeptide repeat protein, partial [Parachlamydia sp.]|nr:tetratricopeptide repeat protein [Parachlamydia sp.]